MNPKNRLGRSFFARPTIEVSKDILGQYIIVGDKKGKVIETEAYIGPQDRASHAFGGKITERNRVEYSAAGHVYIYLVYGMYWQLNITTDREGFPGCFLIRAIDCGKDICQTNGPGKLCRHLCLDKSFYGEDVAESPRIWFEKSGPILPQVEISSGPRIGIDYAGPYWAKRKLRFYIKEYEKYLPRC